MTGGHNYRQRRRPAFSTSMLQAFALCTSSGMWTPISTSKVSIRVSGKASLQREALQMRLRRGIFSKLWKKNHAPYSCPSRIMHGLTKCRVPSKVGHEQSTCVTKPGGGNGVGAGNQNALTKGRRINGKQSNFTATTGVGKSQEQKPPLQVFCRVDGYSVYKGRLRRREHCLHLPHTTGVSCFLFPPPPNIFQGPLTEATSHAAHPADPDALK